MSNSKNHEQSIDDILGNIRSAIDHGAVNKAAPSYLADYDLLELTDVVQDDGTIYKVKKDDNIIRSKQIKLSNKIISDNVTSEKLLTDEVIGESTKAITEFVDQILHVKLFNEQGSAEQLRKLAIDAIKPYMQDWLNKNLPPIVREVLNKEIKDLVSRIKSN